MCSIGDNFDNEGEKHMPEVKKSDYSKCNKCKTETPIILLRHKDAYCKECFLVGTNHKFKALLGKSKLIYPKDRVLVSYEVGHPSTALVHLLRVGLDLDTPKKLRFEPVFVFLEDQYHLSVPERQEMINKVQTEVSGMKFPFHLVSFANSISGVNDISQKSLPLSDSDSKMVADMFAAAANKTTKQECLKILKRNMLLEVAKKLNCKFIFTPELSVDIASHLLTNIALGRGSQVPEDTGFCDTRDTIVKILRPLRSFDMKEIAMYNFLHSLEPVSVRQPRNNQYSSIQTLMVQFVNDLQENYPATVATVVKTGDKLALDEKKIAGRCKLWAVPFWPYFPWYGVAIASSNSANTTIAGGSATASGSGINTIAAVGFDTALSASANPIATASGSDTAVAGPPAKKRRSVGGYTTVANFGAMEQRLEKRFATVDDMKAMEQRLEKRMDDKFDAFEKKLEKRIDDKFDAFEKKLEKRIDDKFNEFKKAFKEERLQRKWHFYSERVKI